MIYNYVQNGLNGCGLNGEIGQDQSPQLSWTDAPHGTHSFAVIAFDVTAGFTHWGIYNISGDLTNLPENAGVSGSSYGTQVTNGFGDMSYDGRCPPTGVTPYAHRYVFTIYALDKTMSIPYSDLSRVPTSTAPQGVVPFFRPYPHTHQHAG
jgi:Raf kinase inhibitor-like YbhB/YbcL family protein